MPYSSDTFDHYIDGLVGLLQPSTVCDIGPGAGKYSRLVRNKAKADDFPVRLTAVEIDSSYVERFNLRDLYDEVIVDDALNLIRAPGLRFSLVIIGDCIEHMRKSDGLDLLNFLIYRSGYICVVYPEAFVQDDWEGHAAEAHISTWGPNDFAGWSTLHHSRSGMHLFLVKGYQTSRTRITT
jgi:hypothetical protein